MIKCLDAQQHSQLEDMQPFSNQKIRMLRDQLVSWMQEQGETMGLMRRSNACLAGGSSIGTETLIGTGASVLPGIHIGGHAIVGAGAVVTRNLNDRVTAVGVPASVVKAVS